MEGIGTGLTCKACGKHWEMDIYGQMQATEGETEIPHIPDWYRWERACVRRELEDGTYAFDEEVTIGVQVNLDGLYMIGDGRLVHNENGFRLVSNDGALDYTQSPVAGHTLYSDFFFYEIGDVIGIGNNEYSYFCFPKGNVSVAKARLAVEELYKMKKQRKKA